MKLIVGLGNPGPKYLLTPHNIGFLLIDAWAERLGSLKFREELKAQTAKVSWQGNQILLAKPQTFMNLSGESVRPLMDFYKIEASDLLVIHDDADLPFGQMKFQVRRGPGGHNGIRSIHQHLGHDDYARLKLGVGRPQDPRMQVADYLLSRFQVEESRLIDFLALACDAAEYFVLHGVEKAANRYNSAAQAKES